MENKRLGKIIIFTIIMCCAIGWKNNIFTRVHKVRSGSSFYKQIGKSSLVVTLFYDQQTENAKDVFSSVEKNAVFEEADVEFIAVNVKKSSLQSLAQSFDIQQFPAVILFRDGVEARDKNNNINRLYGMNSVDNVHNFIQQHFEKDIQNAIKRRAEMRQRRAEERRYSIGVGWGLGWGYPYYPYYPYYGYGYPYYGYPYWGVGGYYGRWR